jgi:hypothetical protein
MEVHHYDYYAVANAPHCAAASERVGGRRMTAALGALTSVKLTNDLQRRNEAAA